MTRYTNPDWKPGTPGTFVLLIGVSSYDHLSGGAGPSANDNFGLGQLTVSARTAFYLFRWFKDEYLAKDCPLAHCWTLLSPSREELAYDQDLRDYAAQCNPATYANCEQSILQWHQEMQALPTMAARASRAVFYFVGHGLEVVREKQMLLPSDYLDPRTGGNTNRAIGTSNLLAGLANLQVPHQVFFLDACRNDDPRLRGPQLTGNSILNEDPAGTANPEIDSPVVYATRLSGQAYSPARINPNADLTLFGEQLLDGLRAQPNLRLETTNGSKLVRLYALQEFLNERLNKKYRDLGILITSPVKLGGQADNLPVTEIDQHIIYVHADESLALTDDLLVSRTASVPHLDPTSSFSKLQPILQSERITGLFQSSKVFSFDDAEWAATDQCVLLKFEEEVSSDLQGSKLVRLGLRPKGTSTQGFWIQFFDDQTTYAFTIPANALTRSDSTALFDLILTVEFGRPDFVRNIELSLASDQEPYELRTAAEVWKKYRNESTGQAIKEVLVYAQDILHNKWESYIASVIAGVILLKERNVQFQNAGDDELWYQRQWLKNLALNVYPTQSDALVLWMEQCFRQQNMIAAKECLIRLRRMPVPIFSDCFAYALTRAEMLRRDSDVGPLYERYSNLTAHIYNSQGLLNVYRIDELTSPKILLPPDGP